MWLRFAARTKAAAIVSLEFTVNSALHFRRLDTDWARIYGREFGKEKYHQHVEKKAATRAWKRDRANGRNTPRPNHGQRYPTNYKELDGRTYGHQTTDRGNKRRAAASSQKTGSGKRTSGEREPLTDRSESISNRAAREIDSTTSSVQRAQATNTSSQRALDRANALALESARSLEQQQRLATDAARQFENTTRELERRAQESERAISATHGLREELEGLRDQLDRIPDRSGPLEIDRSEPELDLDR